MRDVMVSVVIPAFNCASTLARCLFSVIHQADVELEIIVVDDASTDSTAFELQAFEHESRLKVVRNNQRRGASFSRNRGLSLAKGTWITFVDADDELPQGSLYRLMKEAERTNVDMVVGAHVKRSSSGKVELNRHGIEEGFFALSSELGQYICHYAREPYIYTLLVHCWGKLLRKEVIEKNLLAFDENLEQLEDVNFNFRFLSACKAIQYVNQPCYVHTIGQPESMSAHSGSEVNAVTKIEHAYRPVADFLINRCEITRVEADSLVKHLLTTTTVIWLIRLSKRAKTQNIFRLAREIRPIVASRTLRKCLSAYNPMPRDSSIIYWSLLSGSAIVCAASLRVNSLLR